MRSTEDERMTTEQILSVRIKAENPNHHLWNNHGTWWCHFTVHLPDFTKERVRLSLETSDQTHARRLRDALLRLFGCAQPANRRKKKALSYQCENAIALAA
jgi:hypothetical protein